MREIREIQTYEVLIVIVTISYIFCALKKSLKIEKTKNLYFDQKIFALLMANKQTLTLPNNST